MRKALLLLALTCLLPLQPLQAAEETDDRGTGDFDYYVLALSWSPGWCATEGRSKGSPQCRPGRKLGWILHGLWPQYETGYPRACTSESAAPKASVLSAMRDIMGTTSLARHEWQAHGTCSGLSAARYFDLSRRAYDKITQPPQLAHLKHDAWLSIGVLQSAFMDANPGLAAGAINVTCKDDRIREVRICLTRSLAFRDCGPDLRAGCSRHSALLDAVE